MSKQRFSALMDDLGTLYGKDVTPSLKRIYWEDFGGTLIEILEAAVSAHRRDPERGRFFPMPADLIAKMPAYSELSANEAWGLCLKSFDESESLFLSDAILDARIAAEPMWNDGDKIGARMAFRDAYDRAVLSRKANGERPTWSFSAGQDREKLAEAVKAALASGMITSAAAQVYLPAPDITPDGAAIAGLLAGGEPVESASVKVREWCRDVRSMFEPEDTASKSEAQREALSKSKRDALAALEKLQRNAEPES